MTSPNPIKLSVVGVNAATRIHFFAFVGLAHTTGILVVARFRRKMGSPHGHLLVAQLVSATVPMLLNVGLSTGTPWM